jgi:CBS domain-containing protein
MNAELPVDNIMTRPVVTIKPETQLNRIHDLFEENRFHHLVVMDHGQVVGMVSKSDYLKVQYMVSHGWNGQSGVQDRYADLRAKHIMTPNPLQVELGDSIGLAADIFRANHLHALPVMDGEELAGILTAHDLLNYAFKEPIDL